MAWIGASLNQRMHCQLLMDTSVFTITHGAKGFIV